MLAAAASHQVTDAFRYLDITLGVCLWMGLTQRFWARSQRTFGTLGDRIAMRVAILSWTFLSMSTVGRDLDRLGEAPQPMLVLSLVGHIIGVVYCATAWSMDREHQHQRNRALHEAD